MALNKKICNDCKIEKIILAKNLCNACYKKQHKKKNVICKSCAKEKSHEAFGLCGACYKKLPKNTINCIKCNLFKELYLLEMCRSCYDRQYVNKKIINCLDCKQDQPHHSKGKCYGCYMKEYQKSYEQPYKICISCGKNSKIEANGICKYCYNQTENVKKKSLEYTSKEEVKLQMFKNHLKSKYNLTFEQVSEKIINQNNQCGICEKYLEWPNRNTHVDHDHITQKVRGILCGKCNRALGLFGDNINGLQKAISYLEIYS